MPRIIIVGAGIIGATLAYRLSAAGAQVTVLDAGAGGQATAGSFGWINASFFANEHHFHLRDAGIAAWHDLQAQAGGLPVTWPGNLWWEEQGDGFEAFRASLTDMGYDSRVLSRAEFAQMAPAIGTPPEQALWLPQEGVAELGETAQALLARAADLGARVQTGVRVRALETGDAGVTGVHTDQGLLSADQVVLAAGIGAPDLLRPLGIELPMLSRPGVTLTTAPVAPCLDQIMAAPGLEFRQLPDGRILAPTSANHQGDPTDRIVEPLADLADRTLAKLRALLPGQDLRAQTTTLVERPVPGDGLPVIGPAEPDGLYVTVLHSGATLAAVVADLAARELLGQGAQNLLAPYRMSRF